MRGRSSSPPASTGRRGCPPGREAREFRGALVHSGDYRDGAPYAARRVLVVGIGNSGAEIATDLVEHGASVDVAVRTAPPVVRREVLGVPVQVVGMALMPLPPALADRIGSVARRIAVGDLSSYGIGRAAWGPFTARRPPLIDVGFLAALRGGRLDRPPCARAPHARRRRLLGRPRGALRPRGGGDRVRLRPGDARRGARGARRARRATARPRRRSPAPGLFFIGYRESPRGTLYEIAREAPLLARRGRGT